MGYAGYKRLIAPERVCLDIRLAYCWAHARRKLVEITRNGSAPIAEDGVKRIGELYRIEAELRGLDPETRLAGRKERSAPLIADMRTWLTQHRARVAGKSPLGEALSYIAKYWHGLCVFLTDGRIADSIESEECSLRRARCRGRELRDRRFAYRDLKAQCRRSVCVFDQHALRHRQRPQAEPDLWSPAVELSGRVTCAQDRRRPEADLQLTQSHDIKAGEITAPGDCMSEPNVTRRAIKRLFVITTLITWAPLIGLFTFLAVVLTPEDSAQGALVVIGIFPLIAFMFVVWVVIAAASAITMFATRSRLRPY
jgi:hypothetical protein